MMNEYAAKEAFGQTEKFFRSACAPGVMQSVMQDTIAKSREFYSTRTAAALDGAKALTELADTVWSSTKMLNDKIIHNATANAEAAFDAAQALAGATSFAEAAMIQREFVQQFFARAAAQSREFFDLSARATQHVIETAQAAVSKSLKAKF
jgi:hypothetical protein